MKNYVKPIDILLVEDSEGDVRLIEEALKEGKLKNRLFTVRNGVEAMEFLLRQGKFAYAEKPDLILLDLNLPKKDGREVLSEIKNSDDLRRIPIIILTTSSSEMDINSMYDLHANCYIVKPIDINKFFEVIKSVEEFWLTIVKLPDEDK